ncbi:MAG: rhodanese-like domain-containing protein [Pseudobdellovibrio sp.]
MKFTLLVLLAASSVFAAETKTTTTTTTTTAPTAKIEAKDELTLIKAGELQKLETDKKANVFVFDANDNQTRTKEGVIPGAVALKSPKEYDLSILPKDKTAEVVFYCGGPMCMASHEAAKRAIKAGYTKVVVMSDGITGWKKAGFETQKFTN